MLEPGDSIFVNGNVLHGVKQLEGNQPEPMPNIVFSGSVVAPESSIIFQKYIKPIALCDQLPFVVFRHNDRSQDEVNEWLKTIYSRLRRQDDCFELAVQRNLSRVFEYLFRNLNAYQRQKFHEYKSPHKYASRRCFHTFMRIIPIQ